MLSWFLHILRARFLRQASEVKPPQIREGSTRLVLAELQRRYDAQHSTWDKLDEKFISLLGWATLTFAVIASLGVKDIAQSGHLVPVIALVLSLILFLGVLVLCIIGLSPRSHDLPMSTDWQVMSQSYLTLNEQDAAEQLLAQYRLVIDRNAEIINRKAGQLLAGFILFALLALTLLATTMYPLWQGYLP